MTFKGVTSRQTDHIRVMANAKGISRDQFQIGMDNGTIGVALDAIKLGGRIRILPEIKPPEGGHIHRVKVRVQLDREWQEAINAVGPNAPDSNDVRKVGDLYLPTGMGTVESEMILVNFGPHGGSFSRAIEWAAQYSLKRTDPRCVFAIGEHKLEFHRELGMDPMYVVATQQCSFGGGAQACDVWWDGSEREAGLSWLEYFGGVCGWFAFASD